MSMYSSMEKQESDEAFFEAVANCKDHLIKQKVFQVLDLADTISGVTGKFGLTPAQLKWTPRQLAGLEERSIAQAFDDVLERLAVAIIERREGIDF